MPAACYLCVALQRLLQNKNSSGIYREPHLCGVGQAPQLTTNGSGSTEGLFKMTGTHRPLSGECIRTPSEVRLAGLIYPMALS